MNRHKSISLQNLIGTIVVTSFVALSGCVSLAGYDQHAYENATTLKAKTVGAISSFGHNCSFDNDKKQNLYVELESAFEYANGIEDNNEAAIGWRLLIDDIVEDYFNLCEKQKGSISEDAFNEYMPILKASFNQIICLEANKRSITKCSSLNDE